MVDHIPMKHILPRAMSHVMTLEHKATGFTTDIDEAGGPIERHTYPLKHRYIIVVYKLQFLER